MIFAVAEFPVLAILHKQDLIRDAKSPYIQHIERRRIRHTYRVLRTGANENVKRNPTLNPYMTESKHRIVKIMITPDTLAICHHHLKLLRRLIALNHRSNTRFNHAEHADRTFLNTFCLGNLTSQLLLVHP